MKKYGAFSIVLLALAFVAACGGRSPQPQYYLLGEEQPIAAPLLGNRPAAVLRQVSLPAYLDRDALVLRADGAVHIAVAEYHLWAEPLGKAVPRLLEESMRPLLREKGLNLLWSDAMGAAFQADVVLLRLDGIPGGSAGISARWRVLDHEGVLLDQGLFTREADAGDNYESMARALGRLLANFGRELAQAVADSCERLAVQSRDSAGKKKRGS